MTSFWARRRVKVVSTRWSKNPPSRAYKRPCHIPLLVEHCKFAEYFFSVRMAPIRSKFQWARLRYHVCLPAPAGSTSLLTSNCSERFRSCRQVLHPYLVGTCARSLFLINSSAAFNGVHPSIWHDLSAKRNSATTELVRHDTVPSGLMPCTKAFSNVCDCTNEEAFTRTSSRAMAQALSCWQPLSIRQ